MGNGASTVGAAAGFAFGGVGGAYLGAELGAALDSGDSFAKQKRNLRMQYEKRNAYDRQNQSLQFNNQMRLFEKHGIHPLFGLGGSTGSAPSGGFSMPGQSESGSHITQSFQAIADFMLRSKEMDLKQSWLDKQAVASAARVQENNTGNDVAIAAANKIQNFDPQTQEIKKGEVQTRGEYPEQNKNVIRPMTSMKIGSQTIWIPMEEMESFMEDPTAPTIAVLSYHGNKNVDWATVKMDWTRGGWKNLTKAEITAATKRMLGRHKANRRKSKRARHGYTGAGNKPRPRPLAR